MAATAPVEILPLGALIHTFIAGKTNIVQNFPKQSLYPTYSTAFFGETIGRVANRIKNAKIDSLNGKSYQLAVNDGVNSLHGGNVGWGKRIWAGPTPVSSKSIPGVNNLVGGESVEYKLRSEDREENYPGTVDVSVVYTTGTQKTAEGKQVNVLGFEYTVKLVGDAVDETVINMTNHSYFNLTGNPTIEGTEVTLCTEKFLTVDAGGIPTSKTPASYTGVQANKTFTLGPVEPNIDDCFIVDPSTVSSLTIDTRSSPLTKLVHAYHPQNKTHLEVLSTEPAFQFYTGKYISIPAVEGLPERGARAGFCVEPSRYVNAVNVPEWRGQTVLKKGETYGARIVYRGWSDL